MRGLVHRSIHYGAKQARENSRQNRRTPWRQRGRYTACVTSETADIAIVGAGAAGLMAGIWAGRAACANGGPQARPKIVLLDGAKSLGAKILVAGGGRCNVTHDVVDDLAFAGSSRNAIRKVLRRFDVPHTIEFFRESGVDLKREETGKLFPTTDKARTVLDALVNAARRAGAEIRNPWRVESVTAGPDSRFIIAGPSGELAAKSVILASGGKSLPKTGSDGHGYAIARTLGHSITPRVFPALVPLTLPKDHFICGLSGLSTIARLEVRSGTGKKLHEFTDSMLCTHFGLSGPGVLDISRYYTDVKMHDASAQLVVNWLPEEDVESVDRALANLGKVSSGRWLRERAWGGGSNALPHRLAEALCVQADVDPSAPAHHLTREKRRTLARTIAEMPLPVTGDRGFAYAEVTAGGVPLSELKLETMESRTRSGLYIIGEVCDVDGRIGGYNFQWAWASGFVAGTAAGSACQAHSVTA